jgi:hypothetical protein
MLKRLRRSLAKRERGVVDLPSILVGIAIVVLVGAWALLNTIGQRTKAIDAGVRNDLSAMAIAQETWITDNPYQKGIAYNGTAFLPIADSLGNGSDLGFHASKNNLIEVAVDADTGGEGGYCVRGSNPDATRTGEADKGYFYYDSEIGGMQDPAVTPPAGGACSDVTWAN